MTLREDLRSEVRVAKAQTEKARDKMRAAGTNRDLSQEGRMKQLTKLTEDHSNFIQSRINRIQGLIDKKLESVKAGAELAAMDRNRRADYQTLLTQTLQQLPYLIDGNIDPAVLKERLAPFEGDYVAISALNGCLHGCTNSNTGLRYMGCIPVDNRGEAEVTVKYAGQAAMDALREMCIGVNHSNLAAYRNNPTAQLGMMGNTLELICKAADDILADMNEDCTKSTSAVVNWRLENMRRTQ